MSQPNQSQLGEKLEKEKAPNPQTNKDPLAPFMGPILELVIRRVLAEVVAAHPHVTTTNELWEHFRTDTTSCVSLAKFQRWLKALGISFETRLVVVGLHPARPTAHAPGIGPSLALGEDGDVDFDNDLSDAAARAAAGKSDFIPLGAGRIMSGGTEFVRGT